MAHDREQLEQQASQNEPELGLLESRLGLKIRSKARTPSAHSLEVFGSLLLKERLPL